MKIKIKLKISQINYLNNYSTGAINNKLPQWCFYLTMDQSKLLLEHMELGDGHIMKNGTIRYDTSSIQLANDYQQLCLHDGYSANLYLKYYQSKQFLFFSILILHLKSN